VTLVELIDRFETVERSIVVVNRTEPDPLCRMLVETFGDDAVDVFDLRSADADVATSMVDALVGDGGVSAEIDDLRVADRVDLSRAELETRENLVLLVENDEIVAASSLEELMDAILLVNSDIYITGARELETLSLPSVITSLDETLFTLRGYPESNRQKLLLITISRFIERVAWRAGNGTLRSSFQRLSRLDDEVGTRKVYEQVSAAGVDTHAYGVPDSLPKGLDVTIHAGETRDFTDTWFVIYRPPNGPREVDATDAVDRGVEGGVALLAVEAERRLWKGVWTFDPERIETMDEYVRTVL